MTTHAKQRSDAILHHRDRLATALVDREFDRHPELIERYGSTGRAKSLHDAGYHLSFLAQALALENVGLFTDYVGWVKVMLAQRGVLPADLDFHLRCLAEVLESELSADAGPAAAGYVRTALAALAEMPEDLPTFLQEGEPLSPLAHQYLEALRRGERHIASRLVLDAVAAGTPVRDIYLHVFQTAQHEIGRLWQNNRMTVAQEHYCTAATQLIMSQLYPHIFAGEKNGRTLVATAVAGDLHELGIRMVADFFEMAGWHTHYLGANTPHPSVLNTLAEQEADVLAISATMPFHLDAVRDLIVAVRARPDLDGIRIFVGGRAFHTTPDLWSTLGADHFARDAQQALTLADRLTPSQPP